MLEDSAPETCTSGDRTILVYLSEQTTLKAVRVDGTFRILVGDDVEIRGVGPDHMAALVGSVMDAYVPAEMASRLMDVALVQRQAWLARREARLERREARREMREARREMREARGEQRGSEEPAC